jgi:hypothetical protein
LIDVDGGLGPLGDGEAGTVTVGALPAPEPATWTLFALGAVALLGYARLRQRAAARAP